MALTNIELYEALKKDVSEESARMIAEAVPRAQDLATKGDLALLKSDLVEVEARLKSYIDSRLLRFTMMIVVPMVLAMLATMVAVVTKL